MRLDRVRVAVYEILALGFCRPDGAHLRRLGGARTRAALSAAAGLLPGGPAGWHSHFHEFRRQLQATPAHGLANELSVEYARLFLGPDVLPCHPYGSVYLDGGQVMGPSTIDVMRHYRNEGLSISAGWTEPADHICLELAFMAFLAGKCSAALERGCDDEAAALLHAQARFLRQHLLRWSPAFAEKVTGCTSAPLYRFLAGFLPQWLSFDEEVLRAATVAEWGSRATCQ